MTRTASSLRLALLFSPQSASRHMYVRDGSRSTASSQDGRLPGADLLQCPSSRESHTRPADPRWCGTRRAPCHPTFEPLRQPCAPDDSFGARRPICVAELLAGPVACLFWACEFLVRVLHRREDRRAGASNSGESSRSDQCSDRSGGGSTASPPSGPSSSVTRTWSSRRRSHAPLRRSHGPLFLPPASRNRACCSLRTCRFRRQEVRYYYSRLAPLLRCWDTRR